MFEKVFNMGRPFYGVKIEYHVIKKLGGKDKYSEISEIVYKTPVCAVSFYK
jgi:hypothetical protein